MPETRRHNRARRTRDNVLASTSGPTQDASAESPFLKNPGNCLFALKLEKSGGLPLLANNADANALNGAFGAAQVHHDGLEVGIFRQ